MITATLRSILSSISVILIVTFIVLSIEGQAAWARGESRSWAVVVGIDRYMKEITPLRCAVADAREFKKTLVESAGFADDDVFLLTSDEKGNRMPDKANIIRWVSYIKEHAQPDDLFIFFFSGHGMEMEKENYLLTLEADPYSRDTLDVSSLKISDLKRYLSDMKAGRKLLFVDACRSDPRSGKGEGENRLSESFSKSLVIKPGAISPRENEFSCTFFSCRVGQRSYEWTEKSMGFFTWYLVKGLRGGAGDPQGEVTVNSLEEYLGKGVPAAVMRERGYSQQPWSVLEGNSGAGRSVVSRVKKPAPAPQDPSVPVRPSPAISGVGALESYTREQETYMTNNLIDACSAGNMEKAEYLLYLNPQLIKMCDQQGITPLHHAALAGAAPLIRKLADGYHADVNKIDAVGGTPLIYAIKSNNIGAVQELISLGADINLPGRFTGKGMKYDESSARYFSEIKKCLAENKIDTSKVKDPFDQTGMTPLHYAAAGGNCDIAMALLKKGAQVNACDKKGNTPIIIAVEAGQKPMVELLVSRGAQVNVRSFLDCTPLKWAQIRKKKDIAEFLRLHGGKE
jgi:ankyrin repeat protein